VVLFGESRIESFAVQIQNIDRVSALLERYMEGIHDRGGVLVAEGVREDSE
jgi:hypothetical protein